MVTHPSSGSIRPNGDELCQQSRSELKRPRSESRLALEWLRERAITTAVKWDVVRKARAR